MKNKIIILLGIALILMLLFLYFTLTHKSQTHKITIKNHEFVPSNITIKKGDIVVFNSEDSVPFWPASNLHPTHEEYSEFDPLRPVDPSKSWSFTFNQKGTWDFHDHLAPSLRGTITVK